MKSVLVIEDDVSSDLILREILMGISKDMKVTSINNAEEALRHLAHETAAHRAYDLIVADIFLSGKATGIDLWAACRELLPRTPVLMTSGISMLQFFATIGRDEIAPSFLPKPYELTECRHLIRSMLS
jgi:DNA-binding NtrC family response regulator